MSKALEYVEELKSRCKKENGTVRRLNAIETALKDYENLKLKHRSMQDAVLDDFKKLKALEIIEGKPLTFHLISKCADYNEYLFVVSRIIDEYQYGYVYSKEEFNLLKEVLL